MANSSTRTKDYNELESSRQMIVQCPGCQTRFAVEAESVAEVEYPRFHCSRCDHVFSMEEGECKELSAKTIEPLLNKPSLDDDTDLDPEPEAFDRPATSSVQDSYAGALARSSASSYSLTGPTSAPENTARALEIPRVFESGHRASPPHESLIDEPESVASPKTSTAVSETKQVSTSGRRNEVGQIEFGFDPARVESAKAAQVSNREVTQSASSQEVTSLARDPFIFRTAQAPKAVSREGAPVESLNLWDPSRPGLEPIEHPNNPFIVLLAPVAAILIVLVGLSLYLRADIGSADRVTAALFPSAPRVAPPGLSIQNPSFRTVLLESGDKVHVISGRIVNKSDDSFRDVQIEGLAFDGAGRTLTEARTGAGSTLAKTRLKSLSVEMISSLQSARAPKRFELKPDGEVDFALALLDDKVKDARYFTTRIYSVRQ